MRARFIPFALIAMLTVGSCNGGGHGHDPSSQVSTPLTSSTGGSTSPTGGSTSLTQSGPPQPTKPTVPTDVPTTGPNLLRTGERPPVMPLEATQHTQAGAVAFAKFFIQTIDWGFATTSGAYMRHYFEPGCVECLSHANGLDNTRKAGHHYLGSRFTITSSGGAALGSHKAEQSVVVTFDLTSLEIVDQHNAFVNGDIAHRGLREQLWLAWRSDAWTVVDSAPA